MGEDRQETKGGGPMGFDEAAMFSRFTDRARRVMALANREAQRHGHDYVSTAHVLVALIQEGSGVACEVLRSLGLTRALHVKVSLVRHPDRWGEDKEITRAAMANACREADRMGATRVGTEHLLLGMFGVDCIARDVLERLEITCDAVQRKVEAIVNPTTLAEGYTQLRERLTATDEMANNANLAAASISTRLRRAETEALHGPAPSPAFKTAPGTYTGDGVVHLAVRLVERQRGRLDLIGDDGAAHLAMRLPDGYRATGEYRVPKADEWYCVVFAGGAVAAMSVCEGPRIILEPLKLTDAT